MKLGLITLGGTISMTSAADGPVRPTQGGSRLTADIKDFNGPDLMVEDLERLGSPQITLSMVGRVLHAADRLVRGGATGVVISQGTDTLEETSYLLDLVWDRPEPLVVTGAMRPSDAPGADGPANLRDALLVAGHAGSRGLGVLVCLGSQVHLARRVHKSDANAPDAFTSPSWGPLARVSESVVVGLPTTVPREVLPRPAVWSEDIRIPVLWSALDDEGAAASSLVGLPSGDPREPRGVVVGAMGSGHLPVRLLEELAPLPERGTPVVCATRCGSGTTTSSSYGYPGSEGDLRRRGFIAAGWLPPLKSRLLLHVLLTNGSDLAEIRDAFARRGGQP